MKVFIGVTLLIFLVMFFPIKIKLKTSYDVLQNKGFFSMFLYSIKLSILKIKFVRFKLILESKRNSFEISIKDLIGQNKFLDKFFAKILGVLKVKSFKFYSNFQLQNNLFLPYMFSSFLYVLFGFVYSYLSWSKNIYSVQNAHFAGFNNDACIINFAVSIQINLFLILYCLVFSLFKSFKK